MTPLARLGHSIVTSALMLGAAVTFLPSILSAQRLGGSATRAYVELLGNGLVWSINIEQAVGDAFDIRVGAGGLPFEGATYVLGFAMAGWQTSRGPHAVRVGLGAGIIRFEDVFLLEGKPQTAGYGTAAFAYRFQPHARGLFLQLAFTPIWAGRTLSPWPGLAVGYAF